MEQLFTLAGIAIGSSGLSAIVVAILNHHWAKKKNSSGKLDALVEAVSYTHLTLPTICSV